MPHGYWGRVLRVDLTEGRIWTEEKDEKFYRTYMGGRGFIAHYLLKETPKGCDPLGPENVLVFAPSVLTGTPIPGTARCSAGAKSPLTGAYGEGEGGGDWGVRFRWTGYDALVVRGRSEKPVYLWITNDTVELRDAETLWGLEPLETLSAIRTEVGRKKAMAAMIGPGGENLTRFACIALGLHNYIGRAGLGAVMGSKNLKAVAVYGKTMPETADKDGVKSLVTWMRDHWEAGLGTMREMGTARGVPVVNAAGGLPTRNFQAGGFEQADLLSGRTMTDTILVDRKGCFACPVNCKRVVQVDDPDMKVGRDYGGPEYESIAGFGSNCGVADLKTTAKANEMCNRFGIDTISTAMMISGSMEAAEKGLLPPDMIEGLDLRFGSSQGVLKLLDLIGKREGLGDILAEGPKGIESRLGPEVAACYVHVKGQPLPLQEPRWKVGMGLGYALAPHGADHMANIHDVVYANEEAPTFAAARNMSIMDAVDTLELSPEKARLWVYMVLNKSINNVLSVCAFMPYSFDQYVEIVKVVTGWNTSSWELMKASERALTLARAFNAREGFTAEDDLPHQRFYEPMTGGTLKGQAMNKDDFLSTREMAYQILGWDTETAAPLPWKLIELGIGWAVDDSTAER